MIDPITIGYDGAMPTTHRESGFRIVIHLDDHEPAHVHAILRGGGVAKIDLGTTTGRVKLLSASSSMKSSDIRIAVRIVEANRAEFLAQWSKHHG